MKVPSRAGPWLQAGLFVVGLGFVAGFVLHSGPREVLAALAGAGAFIPLLALFEVLMAGTDVLSFRTLLAPDAPSIGARAWVRSTAASYSCLVLLPAGRTASEVARATLVAGRAGSLRATTAAAEFQALSLIADGVSSGLVGLGIYFLAERTHHLPALLGTNLLIAGGGGLALIVLIRSGRAARRLAQRFPRWFARLTESAGRPRPSVAPALGLSLAGRAIQVLQYGVAVHAVGGQFGAGSAAVAYGIHAVGATLGVAVPNQLGVVDGAYLLFADALGFGGAPARALALMLCIRVTQIALALVGLLVQLVVRESALAADTGDHFDRS